MKIYILFTPMDNSFADTALEYSCKYAVRKSIGKNYKKPQKGILDDMKRKLYNKENTGNRSHVNVKNMGTGEWMYTKLFTARALLDRVSVHK